MKKLFNCTSICNTYFIVWSLVFLCLSSPLSSELHAASPSKPLVGGLCQYKSYPGEAEIATVKPNPDDAGTFEITFSFHSQQPVQEDFAQPKGKFWSLVASDGSLPRKDFLNRYGIKTGKRFPCSMKVITRGTCTPVLFDLPTIEQGRAQ